ncbi:MAG: biotin--[acetyl-CoA-carboxylase] ligase [Pseudomarimonas sp.]
MSLAAERLRAALPVETAARLPLIEWVTHSDSTNSDLLRRTAQLPDRALLVADAQSAGRGRHGRQWILPMGGNLAMSMFARSRLTPAELGGLSLALGVACAEALRRQVGPEIGLKWPNDIMARGRKLGGLLIELAKRDAAGVDVVVGVGLNLCLPMDAEPAWIGLDELSVEASRFAADRTLVTADLSVALLATLEQFEGDGWPAFAERWDELDVLRGENVRVLTAGAQHMGRAVGVRQDGALRVSCDDGERAFVSAEVSVRRL